MCLVNPDLSTMLYITLHTLHTFRGYVLVHLIMEQTASYTYNQQGLYIE